MRVLNTTIALSFLMVIKAHQSKKVSTREELKKHVVTEHMEAHANQTFYSNKDNKAQFILLLSRYLKSDGQAVHNSTW